MQITFTYRETRLHRVNPGVKLVLSLLLFVLVVFTHNLNTMMYLTVGALVPLFFIQASRCAVCCCMLRRSCSSLSPLRRG